MAEGRQYLGLRDLDQYSRGYRTGVSVALFIGPIWIEEALSVTKSSGSRDIPLYSYSGVYFDRTAVGRYLVEGNIVVAYTKPDYLLEIITEAQKLSMLDGDLEQLISSRRSLFMNTISSRLLDAGRTLDDAMEVASNYVTHISREAELMSVPIDATGRRGRTFNPQSFELTIIKGTPGEHDLGVDIYQNVKIIGHAENSANDDSPQIEVYSFIAQRKPPLVERRQTPARTASFIRSNLLDITRELVDVLADRLMESPDIEVFKTDARTALMTSTDRLAVAGLLNPASRFYGRSARFVEIVYALEYPIIIGDATTGGTRRILTSTNEVEYLLSGSTAPRKATSMRLQARTVPGQNLRGFNNSFGSIISVDRARTATFVSAIASVSPAETSRRLGGSMILPRYQRNDFSIGSFIPPRIVDDASFSYTDAAIASLTYSTLWCCLLGMRSGPVSPNDPDVLERSALIGAISQPVFTFAYIERVEGEIDGDGTLRIAMPVYIDYCALARPGRSGRRAEREFPLVAEQPLVEFTIPEDSDEAISVDASAVGDRASLFSDAVLGVHHDTVDIPDGDTNAYVVSISSSILEGLSARLATDFNKCLYVLPVLYAEEGTVASVRHVDEGESVRHVCTYTPEEFDYDESGRSALLGLCAALGSQQNLCDKVTLVYDWCINESSGYSVAGQNITLNGYYFLKRGDNPLSNTVSCQVGDCETVLTRGSSNLADGLFYESGGSYVAVPAIRLHVFWLVAVLPIGGVALTQEEASAHPVKILADLTATRARYLEIYNITRCDVITHSTMVADALAMDPDVLETPPEGQESGAWATFVTALRSVWVQVRSGATTAVNSFAATLRNSFSGLLNALSDDDGTEHLTYTENSIGRFAGFLRGYAFQVDIGAIVEELLRCPFTAEAPRELRSGLAGELTLAEAFGRADRPLTGTALRQELTAVVTSVLESRMAAQGIRYQRDRNRTIEGVQYPVYLCEFDVITPAPSVVSYGLGEQGYRYLTGLREANMTNQGAASSAATERQLGGYDV